MFGANRTNFEDGVCEWLIVVWALIRANLPSPPPASSCHRRI